MIAKRPKTGTEILSLIFAWIVFMAIAYVLSARPIGVAPDDYSYIAYFTGEIVVAEEAGVGVWAREPLWHLYARSMGAFVGPDMALRATIFLGVIGFFFGASSLNEGGRLQENLFLAVVFVVGYELSMQMYYNQLRQGFALSLFLALALFSRKKGWMVQLGIVATLIHTSFIVILGCGFLAKWSEDSNKRMGLAIVGFVLAVALFLTFNELVIRFFGQRAERYSAEHVLNANFYLLLGVKYGCVLCLLFPCLKKPSERLYYQLSLFAVASLITVCLAYEAGARLRYYSFAFTTILVMRNYRTGLGAIAAVYWVGVSLFQFVILPYMRPGQVSDWVIRWSTVFY